jgi:hypothetical protein
MGKRPKNIRAGGTNLISDIESEILAEIKKAREKWGETLELKVILGS